MPAWCGCYIPTDIETSEFEFEGESTRLNIASLPALVKELEAVGHTLGLPGNSEELRVLARQHQDDDDDDVLVQTFVELELAAREAQRRRQVLWIVK